MSIFDMLLANAMGEGGGGGGGSSDFSVVTGTFTNTNENGEYGVEGAYYVNDFERDGETWYEVQLSTQYVSGIETRTKTLPTYQGKGSVSVNTDTEHEYSIEGDAVYVGTNIYYWGDFSFTGYGWDY